MPMFDSPPPSFPLFLYPHSHARLFIALTCIQVGRMWGSHEAGVGRVAWLRLLDLESLIRTLRPLPPHRRAPARPSAPWPPASRPTPQPPWPSCPPSLPQPCASTLASASRRRVGRWRGGETYDGRGGETDDGRGGETGVPRARPRVSGTRLFTPHPAPHRLLPPASCLPPHSLCLLPAPPSPPSGPPLRSCPAASRLHWQRRRRTSLVPSPASTSR